MFLTKTKAGIFLPTYPSDRDAADKVPVGGEVYAAQRRNIGHHRKFFALMNLYFSNQNKYDNFDLFRKITLINAGHYDEVPDSKGNNHKIPHSISFENMNQEEFEKVYNDVLAVVSKQLNTSAEEINNELESFY